MNANEIFEAALQGVESRSIKAWASSDHNKPLFIKFAQTLVGKKNAVELMTIAMISWAMG